MAKIRFNASSKRDMAEIDEFGMSEFGAAVADEYSRGFRAAFDVLRRYPLAGIARPELGKGIRSLVHRKHRIFYVVKADVVQILRVIHHSRDVRRSHLQ